jgi:hypothetical protein
MSLSYVSKPTSGEGNAQIVILIVRLIAIHVRAIGIKVTDIHQVAIGVPRISYQTFRGRAMATLCGQRCTQSVIFTQ